MLKIAITKTILFLLCLLPAAHYALGMGQETLGAEPVETFTRGIGNWALYLLLLTLAITPLRRLTGQVWLLPLRRTFGLFAFCYACLHLYAYCWLDPSFSWANITLDITKRPFIIAGMIAFALLAPLAATSTKAMKEKLGGKRWQALHRLIYPAAMLAVLHYTWMTKADAAQPLLLGLILLVLLGLRLWWWLTDASKTRGRQRRIIPIQVRH